MNSLLRNNQRKRTVKSKLLITFFVVAVVLFAMNYFSDGVVTRFTHKPLGVAVLSNDVVAGAIVSFQQTFAQKETLQNKITLLEERIVELELYELNNLVLASENEELRRLLGEKDGHLNTGILARVLSHGGSYPYGTLLISHEQEKPFAVGSLVFGAENIVLAKIVQADGKAAQAQLLAAPKNRTEVLVGVTERITQMTMEGVGNGNLLGKVARDAPISVGDPVVLREKETAIVGYVQSIETTPTDAFQNIRVRTPVNTETIRFVRVQ